MDHEHHHHHHQEDTASTTVLPNVTTMVVNALINTTSQAMAAVTNNHHHRHDTGGHEGHNMGGHDMGVHDGHAMNAQEGHSMGGHDGHNVGDMMHMDMTFHTGTTVKILFEEWDVTTVGGLIGSVIGIFFLALLYEGLKFLREYLYREHFNAINYSSVAVVGHDGKPVTELHKITQNRIFGWPHLLQTSLHVVQVLLSYFLMLIFMTYNVWLCLAVLLGSGLGYFFFGWRKATIVDISEHCH